MSAPALPSRRWLHRLPVPWRAPALALVTERPVALVGVVWLAVAAAAVLLAARGHADADGLLPFATLVVALGLGNGIVARDRIGSRWLLLFQRAGRPLGHYARSLVLAVAAAVVLAWAARLATATAGGSADGLAAALAGDVLLCVLLLAVTTGLSAVSGGYDAALVLLLAALTVLHAPAMQAMGAPGWLRDATYFLLLPLDGLRETVSWLRGDGPAPSASLAAHLALYPAAWLALAAWRIAARARGDAPAR